MPGDQYETPDRQFTFKPIASQYAPLLGLPELRQAVAEYAEAAHPGIAVDSATETLTTLGATEALSSAMLALLNPGDEVINTACTLLATGHPAHLMADRAACRLVLPTLLPWLIGLNSQMLSSSRRRSVRRHTCHDAGGAVGPNVRCVRPHVPACGRRAKSCAARPQDLGCPVRLQPPTPQLAFMRVHVPHFLQTHYQKAFQMRGLADAQARRASCSVLAKDEAAAAEQPTQPHRYTLRFM